MPLATILLWGVAGCDEASLLESIDGQVRVSQAPETVSDLSVVGSTSGSVTVSLTQVDDGTGHPAHYALRYGSPTITGSGSAALGWEAASSTEVLIQGGEIGTVLEYQYPGLDPGTDHEFRVRAYRGSLGEDAVLGDLSNIASGATEPTRPGAPAFVQVTPSEWALTEIGATLQLSSEAYDDEGSIVPDAEFEWISENPDVATVSEEGLVTAQKAGAAVIAATLVCNAPECEGVTDSSSGTVTDDESATDPTAPETVTDMRFTGATTNSIRVTFTQVDDGTGQPANYALRYGSPTIIRFGSATLGWMAAGTTEVLIKGSEIGGVLEYEYPDLEPGTNHQFRLRAYRGTPGQDVILGGLSNIASGATDPVDPGPPVSMLVTPSDWSLTEIGATIQLSSEAYDDEGNTVPDAEFEWTSSNPGVATVSEEGLVTAQQIGSVVILATLVCNTSGCEGITDTSNGTVVEDDDSPPETGSPGAVTDLQPTGATANSVTVTFTEVDDGTGEPAHYVLRYATPPISWGAANGTEVAIDGTEIGSLREFEYTGLSSGTDYEFQLVAYRGTLNAGATFGDLSNVAEASTQAGEAVEVKIEPSQFSLGVGESQQLTATALDADGNPVGGISFTWSSSNTSVATVSGSGVVTAQSEGAATITANGSPSGTASVSVTDADEPPGGDADPIFYDGFESGDNSHREGGYGWAEASGSPDHRINDGGFARAGDWAHRFRQDGQQRNRLIRLEGPGLTEFWWEYWIRVPSNYDHGTTSPDNNKWAEFFNRSNRENTLIAPNTRRRSGGGSTLRLALQIQGVSFSETTIQSNWITPSDRGRWVRHRYHVNTQTGLLRIWKDDTRVVNLTGLPLTNVGAVSAWQIMGWNNAGFPQQITWYIDEVRLYADDPGW